MKKIVVIYHIAILLFMALLPLWSTATDCQISYTATYDGNVSLGSITLCGVTYSTVTYDGLCNAGATGDPFLPVDYIRFSVPYNATNFTVTATPVLDEEISLDYPVLPSQIGSSNVILPNNASYSSAVYPSSLSSYENESMLAGDNHIITVAVYPITLWSGTTLKVYSAVNLTINYELSGTPSIKPIVRQDSTLLKEGFDLACQLVVNPADVRNNAASQQSNYKQFSYNTPYIVDTAQIRNACTYLIVTTPEMKHSLRRIAAIKKQKGMSVKVVTLEDVLNDPLSGIGDDYLGNGNCIYTDDAGKLRQYLREHFISKGTKYVLLAGSDIPNRCESDMSNNWYSDYDLMHELYVGRLMGSSSEQSDNYTDKLLRYEFNPGNGDHSYLNRALYTEGPNYEYSLSQMRSRMSALFPEDTVVTHDIEVEFSGNDFLDLIDTNHYGFICTLNDAAPTYIELYNNFFDFYRLWAIDTVKTAAYLDHETGNGLNRMNNKNYPMVYYCPIGQTIPYEDVDGYDIDVSYGESFTMGKDYGGPAYIGYTIESAYPDIANWTRIVGEYFAEALPESDYVINSALTSAKELYHGPMHEEIAIQTSFLGDPTLEMWSGIPNSFTDIELTRTDNAVTISGISTDQTKIGYCCNDGVLGSSTTSNSSITLSISPNSSIMLYKHNYIPYIAPLVLQNTTIERSQYVFASDVIAGKAVDNGRTQGDVIVKDGADYEIEATGKVILNAGFKIEKGAAFSVRKSSYK